MEPKPAPLVLEGLLLLSRRIQRDLLQGLPQGYPSVTGMHALMLISRMENPIYCTSSHLARRLGITDPSISSLVKTLLASKLIERIDGYDRRTKPLRLTSKGRAVLARGLKDWVRTSEALLRAVPEARLKDMLHTIETLNTTYKERDQDDRDIEFQNALTSERTKKVAAKFRRESETRRKRAAVASRLKDRDV